MATFTSYSDLSDVAKRQLVTLEEFIGDVEGKDCVIDSGDGGQVIDDGTIDAVNAVTAFNEIVALLRTREQTIRDNNRKPVQDEQSEKARALVQARWIVEKHMKAFDQIITHPDTLKASIADAIYNFSQPPMIATVAKE